MGILSILMVLDNLDLHQEGPQRPAIFAASDVGQGDVDPADGLFEFQRGKGDQVVVAGACEQGDPRRGVGFVGAEVEEDADGEDGDEAREMYI